jgi:UDP-N-acetylmuramoyl-L-alanyl-D-glutamate--2,6-diaminopimelate ligase
MGRRAFPVVPQHHTSIGVTGTNGKTSTVRWIATCLAQLARSVAQVTTLGSFLDDEPFEATSDFDGLVATVKAGIDRGGRFAAIEVTSEALARGFARKWPFRVGVFTNLTHDHLDAHGSPEHYLASKAQLFVGLPRDGVAVLNARDPASPLLAEVIREARVVSFAVPSRGPPMGTADLEARSVEVSWAGTRIRLDGRGALAHVPTELSIPAIGEIYAENALAALAAALMVGVPPEAAARALSSAPLVPGRFQVVSGRDRPRVVVDFAHTPDALARTLSTARHLCKGRLWVVFGAGGERDSAKRAPMGAAATTADNVVLTSDNPRGEDAGRIAEQIRVGIRGSAEIRVELDRRCAIRKAICEADESDVVVIAGKGHEKRQIIGTTEVPFDDVQEALAALAERARIL